MIRAYADTPDGQIHYRTEGSGEPLLLLHAVGRSSKEFSKVIPLLSKNFRVIAMDIIGMGDSDQPTHEYSVQDYAQSVINFLDSLSISKVSIAGVHLAALIAGEIAAAYPERADKLILVGLPLYNPEKRQERLDMMAKARSGQFVEDPMFRPVELKSDGSHMLFIWERAKNWLPGVTLEEIHERTLDNLKVIPRGEEGHWAAFPYDAELRLPLIKSPALLICGTSELEMLRQSLEPAKNLIPRSKIVMVEGGMTSLPRLKPKEFAEATLAFLQDPGI